MTAAPTILIVAAGSGLGHAMAEELLNRGWHVIGSVRPGKTGTELHELALAPGWIRTALGGPDAPFTIEESIPALVDVMLAQQGVPGLHYLDRFGKTVPW